MQESDYSVDQLVAQIRHSATGDTPAELRSAFSDFLRSTEPSQLPRAWGNGRDVIGEAYMQLLSPLERRPDGQVFTPGWAAEVMVRWAVQPHHKVLLDPGCGSGVMLQAAGALTNRSQVELHGFDIDSVALDMTRLNCALRGLSVEAELIDFLRDELSIRPDCVVANPPFTRHHELTQDFKNEVHEGLGARLNLRLTRQASLHALFLARSIEIATDGARLAFITPSQWLSTKYGQEVRQFVESSARIDAIIELPNNFFPNARTSASLTFFTKGERASTPRTLSLSNGLIPVGDVLEWLNQPAEASADVVASAVSLVSLGELATVSRGLATGHNAFFVLSEAERVQRGIPLSAVRRCISSPRVHASPQLTEDVFEAMPKTTPRWLLCVGPNPSEGPVIDYIDYGEEIGVDERYLTGKRSTWYELKCHDRYPILFSYLNKDRPHVVVNDAHAVPLNTWLVIRPKDGVDLDKLVRALSSDSVARLALERSRHYGHGLWKLEPSELKQLPIPWDDPIPTST